MTNDRAHFLGATAQAFHGEGLDFMGIAPLDLLALLAERERLRGALEEARGFLSVIPMARDRERLRATIDQALEATDDQ